jgi:hypothetical protein
MPTYNEIFKLSAKAINLIEFPFHSQFRQFTLPDTSSSATDNHNKIVELIQVRCES